MFKKLFITLVILVSLVSLVSLGLIVPLHLDGSGGYGHLHADYGFQTHMSKKDSHFGGGGFEKVVAVFNELLLLFPEEVLFTSFDETTNSSKRAPPV